MNSLVKFLFLSILSVSFLFSADILAVVNGKNITTQVAPKDFDKLDKKMQKKVVDRLIDKRLASDYALSTKISNSDEFKKVLEHVFQMSSKNEKDNEDLANLFKKDSIIDGYTKEQLYSKKGLLAFDFILNKKSKELKPSDDVLKKYYETRVYKYDTPAMLELLTIVVEDKKLSSKIIEELKSSKDTLETFSKLASKYSLAPSAKKYGYFGKLPINELNKTLKPILKDFKRGDFVKEAIKTEFGYQIFYVLNDIPEFKSTFTSVRSMVEEEFIKNDVKRWALDKIKELKEKSIIQIKI
ncbi:MAG TPA: hypothetical protein EYG93_06040 [Sulfurospirillum arcachonense]|nr:hypothetical protein [Sulfurospirillum arcachonense]HIP44873.1 hypothetical protein [Sulfurospirillum arcachonense]